MDILYFLVKAPLFIAGCAMILGFVFTILNALYSAFGPVGGTCSTLSILGIGYGWVHYIVLEPVITSSLFIGLSVPLAFACMFFAVIFVGTITAQLTGTMPQETENASEVA